ncbi:MAG TPA: carbohydrate-binding protein [Amycolatopsis sp.]|nr:carbohydrate-binding protein [Amycolatopsis sp.]
MRWTWLRASLAACVAAAGVVGIGVAHRPDAAAAQAAPAAAGRSAVYGGGPFYDGGQAVMDDLRSSGFTTVILWSIHVHENGDLFYNDTLIVSNGQYVGDAGWSSRLKTLKQAPTSVNRIEVSIGAWGVADWQNIDTLMAQQGTGTGSILYRNFLALRNVTGADAVNDDDESHYDVNSTVTFGKLANTIGYAHFTFAPYTFESFWQGVKNGLGSLVDRVYLQDYAGGTGNDPGHWSQVLGMPVDPGLWSKNGSGCSSGDSPAQVEAQMRAWHTSAGIPGGFMWLYDDIRACSAQGTAADYARAINNATGDGSTTPPTTTTTAPPTTTVPPTTPTSGTYAAWQAGHAYVVGDRVSYQGSNYQCRQSHTSLTGWEPPNVPALWSPLS